MPNKETVYNLLVKNPRGLTIQEISDQLHLARNTVAIALAELRGAGKVEHRDIGKAKLHYTTEGDFFGGTAK